MNNGNLKNLTSNTHRTPEEIRESNRRAGIASGKSRRAKKTLSDRIKLALTISTNENLKVLKEQIREMIPNRHTKENKMVLKTLLAQTKTMRDCGVDVYNLLRIAENPESQEMALKATNALWDREEGKPKQSSTIESNVNSTTTVKYIEAEEKKGYLDHIKDVTDQKDQIITINQERE